MAVQQQAGPLRLWIQVSLFSFLFYSEMMEGFYFSTTFFSFCPTCRKDTKLVFPLAFKILKVGYLFSTLEGLSFGISNIHLIFLEVLYHHTDQQESTVMSPEQKKGSAQ